MTEPPEGGGPPRKPLPPVIPGSTLSGSASRPPVIPDSAMAGAPTTIGGTSTITEGAPAPDAEIPSLASAPPLGTDEELLDAVGVKPSRKERRAKKKRDKELEALADAAEASELDAAELDPVERAERRGRRRGMLVLSISLALGVIVVAFALLGRANHDRLVFACTATEIRAEEGRAFPPWGTDPLEGPMWAPIAIPPKAECKERETESMTTLTTWYLEALTDQAEERLTAKDVTELDLAAKQLEQALLLARHPDRRDARRAIERLLGDVDYWRATARLRGAIDALDQAAKQFEDASTRPPEHARDAAAWAEVARRAKNLLGGGPGGAAEQPGAGSGAPVRQPPPFGVALPVEPVDAAPAPAERPDAGLPTGGVLL